MVDMKLVNGVKVPLSESDIIPVESEEKIAARLSSETKQLRNHMLALSDWTQLPDATADKEEWATYRQALRDITDQPGFPHDVSWPKEPV